MPRILLLAALFLAAALGVFWFLSDGAQPPRAADAAAVGTPPTDRSHVAGSPRPHATARNAAGSPPTAEIAGDIGEESSPTGAPMAVTRPTSVDQEPVLLRGSAVLVDPDGREHVAESGTLILLWRGTAGSTKRAIPVETGHWSVEVPPNALLFVQQLELGGGIVWVDPREYAVPADRFLELRGAGLSEILLHVVDARTGAELKGVEILYSGSSFLPGPDHPGARPEGEPLLSGADSPVRVEPRAVRYGSRAAYWVHATGRAWGILLMDHASGGERTIALEAAATVEVQLVGSAPWLQPLIRLAPPEHRAQAPYGYAQLEPDGEDRATFTDVAAGTYRVSVGRGWADSREVYGEAAVEVSAGERQWVQVEVALPEQPQPTRIGGTLVVPGAWSRNGLRLTLAAQDAASVWVDGEIELPREVLVPEDPRGERLAWSTELPAAGNYELMVHPFRVRRLVQVPAEGLDDVDIAVAAPAEVEVRVLEDATGKELEVERIYWQPPRVQGIRASPLIPATRSPTTGRCTFRVPAGPIQLSPAQRSLAALEEGAVYDVVPGHNRLDLRVQRNFGAEFSFVDGSAEIPFHWGWGLNANAVGHDGRVVARSIGVLWFDQPGTYTLTLGTPAVASEEAPAWIEGYASPDGTRFVVKATEEVGELTRVAIVLERE